jgi:hypothetical protein
MAARGRRGSARHELALNLALFASVATVGWTSPSAFHDALVGVAELAVTAVSAPAVRDGVPDMLAAPGAVVVPLWSEPTAAERLRAECASQGKADPWATDACATPAGAEGDATPWASTPWGVE